MKGILRYILNLVFWLALANNISGQNNPADSIRILFRDIIEAPKDNKCKTFKVYKDSISKIPLKSLDTAISKIIEANSLFLNDKGNNGCPLKNPVTRLQAILHNLKSDNSTDTASLLQALLFARSKFSGFVRVQLMFEVSNPLVTVQSFDPFILPPQPDSTVFEVYLVPGRNYQITVSHSGYYSSATQVIFTKDSQKTISLRAELPPVPGKCGIGLWWIPIIIILLILILIAWRIFKNDRHAVKEIPISDGAHEESVKKLNEKVQNQEVLINTYAAEIEKLKSKKPDLPSSVPSGKYFLTEMMMTAGPRKKMNVDRDLGEDVCGFVMNHNEALMWIMDGSSDFFDPLLNPDTKREYFSSRLLAQSLGRKLRNLFTAEKSAPVEEVFENMIKEVRDEWLAAINSLPEPEKIVLRKNLLDGIQPDCASTVLFARLTLDGALKIYRAGDSKLLSFFREGEKMTVDTALSTKNDKIGPVSFLLSLNQNNFDIIIRQSKPEITERTNIHSVIGYSDGIGKATEKTLIRDYPVNSEKARTEIISQLQGTSDDKSMFIIEIKKS